LDFYGITYTGGQNNAGTVFKVDTKGNESVLHNFVGGKTDGCNPTGGLIRDASGNLYGTTAACGGGSWGTVFKLSKNGQETLLHSFSDSDTDGAIPQFGSLLLDKNGNLYGVTMYGGSNRTCLIYNNGHCLQYDDGHGTFYRLSTNGTSFTVLQNFGANHNHGGDGFPMGTPIMDADGNIYGTSYGCDPADCLHGLFGTVWEWTNAGAYQVLLPFSNQTTEGSNPIAGVILDSKGNLYGNTEVGGTYGYGTVFELSKSGSENLLHSFDGADGAYPVGGLIFGPGKVLYGTTYQGGTYGQGVVWSLQLDLP